jgi:hypothetical protein
MFKRSILATTSFLFAVSLLISPLATNAQEITPTPTPDIQSCIPQAGTLVQRFGGARPESAVLQDVDLLTQPQFDSQAKPIKLVTIPKGARVVVFDIDNVQNSWYRVLWACDNFAYAGWVPKKAVHFFISNANPIVAPPGCVQSITTLNSLDDTWISTFKGRLVAVVDLFRAPNKTSIHTFFYLTRDGRQVHDKDREIHTQGPFLLNGEVVNATVSKGMEIGFNLTEPNPAFRVFSTIYLVPDGCKWDV